MVPLKWQFEEFFPSVAAAFLCVALGRLRKTSEPGVRWSEGSSLNFELKLRHSASEKYSALSVLGFTVSDWDGSGYSFYSIFFRMDLFETHKPLNPVCVVL